MKIQRIGVVGAGTMGTGIAQVAAQGGYEVFVSDPFPQQLERCLETIRKFLDRAVEKGRLQAGEREAVLGRIRTTTALSDLSAADFVIEAALEDLELKKKVFAELDQCCRSEVILATNTSSLSITAVGALTRRQDRVVGMHFFNPVPLMPLVEVIRGHRTSAETAEATFQVASRFGKHPVRAQDTPGFIVNRVARPYYAEGLKLFQDQVADAATIDAALRAVGFRLGPFELMDLIGIDVNLAVTRSVYGQHFDEPRFRPSLVQAKMVQAGLLGRKTGAGFYTYGDIGREQAADPAPAGTAAAEDVPAGAVLLVAAGGKEQVPLAGALRQAGLEPRLVAPGDSAALSAAGHDAWLALDLTVAGPDARRATLQQLDRALPAEAWLVAAAPPLPVTDLAAVTGRPGRCLGLGGLPPYDAGALEWIVPWQVAGEWGGAAAVAALPGPVAALSRRLNRTPLAVSDGMGGLAARVVACLVNEACHALTEGVATPADIDAAMRLGTSYPFGPLEWGDRLGPDFVLHIMQGLYADLAEDRYRPAPLLRRLAAAGGRFRP